MIAASPNCRSRSSSNARLPQCLASETPRFVAVTVLPVPPFGENTVTSRPCRRPSAVGRFPTWPGLRVAKTTVFGRCGGFRDGGRGPDELDLGMRGERVPEVRQPVAVARDVDPVRALACEFVAA